LFVVAVIHEKILTTPRLTLRVFWLKSIFCEMALLRAREERTCEKYLEWCVCRLRRVSTLLISCLNKALLSLV
jgi:hypothetical protein